LTIDEDTITKRIKTLKFLKTQYIGKIRDLPRHYERYKKNREMVMKDPIKRGLHSASALAYRFRLDEYHREK